MPLHTLNPYLLDNSIVPDPLYHFGIQYDKAGYQKEFGDVKFVCTGGSANRMERLAISLYGELQGYVPNLTSMPKNLSKTDRYKVFKVGPVLCINHGIGMASLSVMLHETFKLLFYAGCEDVCFFRCGTSGGLGVEPGTVVVTNKPLNGLMESKFEQFLLGERCEKEAILDEDLGHELLQIGNMMYFPVVRGNTMSTDGFYEEQGRQNGFICTYTEEEIAKFIKRIHNDHGVLNIEMEAECFAALTHAAGVKAAIVCVTILNRLKDDIPGPHGDWDLRPTQLVTEYIKKHL